MGEADNENEEKNSQKFRPKTRQKRTRNSTGNRQDEGEHRPPDRKINPNLATENRQKGVAFSLDLRFRGSSGFVYLYKWEAWNFLIHYPGEMGRTVLPLLFSLSLLPLLSSHGGRGKGRQEEALI
jgi:hypothetical protein